MSTISKFGATCSRCGRGFQPIGKFATLCLPCLELGEATTRKAPVDYQTGQIHLQTDLLSGATQDPIGRPRLKRTRRTIQDFFDRTVDTFVSQGILCGRLTALESQRREVQQFATRAGDGFTYRGFSVAIVPDEDRR